MLHNLQGLYKGKRKGDTVTPPDDKIGRWRAALIGVPVGLSNGLLGIGGGIMAVPLQQVLLRIPLQRAIANSSLCIVFVATLRGDRQELDARPARRTRRRAVCPDAVAGYRGDPDPDGFCRGLPRRLPDALVSLGWLRIVFACLMLYFGVRLILMPKTPSRPATKAPPATQVASPVDSQAVPGSTIDCLAGAGTMGDKDSPDGLEPRTTQVGRLTVRLREGLINRVRSRRHDAVRTVASEPVRDQPGHSPESAAAVGREGLAAGIPRQGYMVARPPRQPLQATGLFFPIDPISLLTMAFFREVYLGIRRAAVENRRPS